jgi:hypothetical protein
VGGAAKGDDRSGEKDRQEALNHVMSPLGGGIAQVDFRRHAMPRSSRLMLPLVTARALVTIKQNATYAIARPKQAGEMLERQEAVGAIAAAQTRGGEGR